MVATASHLTKVSRAGCFEELLSGIIQAFKKIVLSSPEIDFIQSLLQQRFSLLLEGFSSAHLNIPCPRRSMSLFFHRHHRTSFCTNLDVTLRGNYNCLLYSYLHKDAWSQLSHVWETHGTWKWCDIVIGILQNRMYVSGCVITHHPVWIWRHRKTHTSSHWSTLSLTVFSNTVWTSKRFH